VIGLKKEDASIFGFENDRKKATHRREMMVFSAGRGG
jgi:hypothetical protein